MREGKAPGQGARGHESPSSSPPAWNSLNPDLAEKSGFPNETLKNEALVTKLFGLSINIEIHDRFRVSPNGFLQLISLRMRKSEKLELTPPPGPGGIYRIQEPKNLDFRT